jgi:hypothetical protein
VVDSFRRNPLHKERRKETSWGRGSRRFDNRFCCQRLVGLASMWVQAVVKGSPILSTPLAFRTSFVGFNEVKDGFEEP